MKHNEFKIGEDFFTATGRWRCTDIGTRVIVAIQPVAHWCAGPPYSCPEVVFDEFDIEGCTTEEPA